MSKAGTCKHCYAIKEMWQIPMHRQPHEPAERHVVMPEDTYTCQWLDQFKELPPALRRYNGSFDIRSGDCDACTLYEPVATLEQILST